MRRLIAIIPARGGSKRLKNKNIYPLKGKPIIQYTIDACKASEYVAEVVVSSDSDEILDVAAQSGAMPLRRSAELSDDNTPKIVAIRDAIKTLNKTVEFDDVAILQANSPQIQSDHIDTAYRLMLDHKLWEVMSADDNGVQNAAIRIVKKEVAFHEFLSAHCGFTVCNLLDIHTIEDIKKLEAII